MWRVYAIINTLQEWKEDKARFKDYVSSPKESGYQSLHVTLTHRVTGIVLEIQVICRAI